MERIRESLAKELVNLSNKIEILESQLKNYPELDDQHKVFIDLLAKKCGFFSLVLIFVFQKLKAEYTALLQMYGEKEEEADELRLDLQDVKEMYKLQVSLAN